MSLGAAQKAELIDAIYDKHGLPAAAEHCHVRIRDVMEAVEIDTDFADAVERAMTHLTPLAEQEMVRRAVFGTESVVVSQGRVVMMAGDDGLSHPLVERKYSDSLLTKFLEGRKRDVFGPKVEIAHKHSGFMAVPVMDAAQLQALMDAPGDEVAFIDADYQLIGDGRPLPVSDGEIEDDYPSGSEDDSVSSYGAMTNDADADADFSTV